MIVTSITPLDKRRSKVFLDEGFALVLYKGEIKKYQLTEGSPLEEGTYREIVGTVLHKRARERALYLLKRGDRTEQEMRQKLKEGYYPQEAVDETIRFLKEYRFVDDERYAQHYVQTHGTTKSRRQISYYLQQKGVPREILEKLLEESQIEEEGQIRKLLKKKGYDRHLTDGKERARIAASLGRKGFSFDMIKRLMGEDCGEELL